MSLDKLTLHAQLAVLESNRVSLDNAIAEKIKHLENATIDLHETRGARRYHDLMVQQINNALAQIAREEQSATPAS